jgi:hypothetical protein
MLFEAVYFILIRLSCVPEFVPSFSLLFVIVLTGIGAYDKRKVYEKVRKHSPDCQMLYFTKKRCSHLATLKL